MGVSLESRLKSLTHQAPVMVFMKGDPSQPKCGFSKQLMPILQETKVPFSTFDILTDEEVRQGLKTFSNWPTFPQVYVKGELIGGLDIIKELVEAGDLTPTSRARPRFISFRELNHTWAFHLLLVRKRRGVLLSVQLCHP